MCAQCAQLPACCLLQLQCNTLLLDMSTHLSADTLHQRRHQPTNPALHQPTSPPPTRYAALLQHMARMGEGLPDPQEEQVCHAVRAARDMGRRCNLLFCLVSADASCSAAGAAAVPDHMINQSKFYGPMLYACKSWRHRKRPPHEVGCTNLMVRCNLKKETPTCGTTAHKGNVSGAMHVSCLQSPTVGRRPATHARTHLSPQ